MKILSTADWHIRSTVPGCLDMSVSDWMDFQRKSLERIKEIAVEHHVCEVDVGGDLFHSEQTASNECIFLIQDFAREMDELNIPVFIMAGNHDLPHHSSSNISKSAIGVLLNSKCIRNMGSDAGYVKGCNFDIDDYGSSKYIFRHVLTVPSRDKPDFLECETPESLLMRYPDAMIIFTGDYHRRFEHHDIVRHVFNSGCLTRQASDFEDYSPGVYVVDLEDGSSEFVEIGLEQKFNHNGQEKKDINEAVENFVAGIKKENVTLDFVGSLRNEVKNHEKEIQDRVGDWIERSGN